MQKRIECKYFNPLLSQITINSFNILLVENLYYIQIKNKSNIFSSLLTTILISEKNLGQFWILTV